MVEELYMRPIFSGALDNSNNDHTIAGWVKDNGHKETSLIPLQVHKDWKESPKISLVVIELILRLMN